MRIEFLIMRCFWDSQERLSALDLFKRVKSVSVKTGRRAVRHALNSLEEKKMICRIRDTKIAEYDVLVDEQEFLQRSKEEFRRSMSGIGGLFVCK